MRRIALAAGISLLSLGTLATFGAAQKQTPAAAPAMDPAIQTILKESAQAYRAAGSLGLTLVSTQGQRSITAEIVFTRDGLLAATVKNGADTKRVVADGARIVTDSSKDSATKYVVRKETGLSPAINALAGTGGTGIGLLPILLTSPKAEAQIVPGKPLSLKKVADETIDNALCDVIVAVVGEPGREFEYRFFFAKSDKFLRKLAIGPVGGVASIVETYANLSVKPTVTTSTFKYVPADGAVAMDPPKAPTRYDERLKVGADPLPLVGSDLDGKPIAIADYKGKVVLIDFWATWCGPCIAELPNVLDAYQKYHGQGFEILGISLDREGDKQKLVNFAREKGMTWRHVYDGKYWEAANAVGYGVRSIPFTLLIGKDGKIAAVGARGESLAPAIEAALKK